jgi:hypothetical protein
VRPHNGDGRLKEVMVNRLLMRSYNKSQREALFLKFVLVKNLTSFGQIYSPSSGVSQHCIVHLVGFYYKNIS